MALKKTDYDFINLAVSIKGQADRLGIEHDGVPHEGVVASIAQRAVDAEARIARAAKLHRPFEWSFGFGAVKSCRGCADRGVPQEKAGWPCADAVALGLNEGED